MKIYKSTNYNPVVLTPAQEIAAKKAKTCSRYGNYLARVIRMKRQECRSAKWDRKRKVSKYCGDGKYGAKAYAKNGSWAMLLKKAKCPGYFVAKGAQTIAVKKAKT